MNQNSNEVQEANEFSKCPFNAKLDYGVEKMVEEAIY